ncbi:MAG: ABC transporter permease [Anaerolineae bacterium]|nr:ABC transporter permease [Anaerolineae bacterium]MDW8102380.1 ABC transporter permease [Anaerolineae bacterium]
MLRRLISLIIVLWLVSFLTFFLLQVIPGDPAQLILGIEAPPEALESLRARLGLDKPWPLRYIAWLADMLRGNMGMSIRLERPVSALIAERLPVTLSLAFAAMFIALVISFPAGIFSALKWNSPLDYFLLFVTQLGIAIPSFWVGILLILVFSLYFRLFPTGGFVSWWENPLEAFRHLLLPSVSLGLVAAAFLTRMLRSSMLEVLNQAYITVAKAKGLTSYQVIFRHALKNALIPVITLAGIQWSFLMGGSIVIEQVFALPGLGRLLLSAVYTRDIPLIQGLVMFITTVVVVSNFIVDLLYAYLDPRIRLE